MTLNSDAEASLANLSAQIVLVLSGAPAGLDVIGPYLRASYGVGYQDGLQVEPTSEAIAGARRFEREVWARLPV